MTLFNSSNCPAYVFQVRLWTKAIHHDDGDTITYDLSSKPIIHLESHLINLDEEPLRVLIRSKLPKRGRPKVLEAMLDATCRACVLEDPYEAAANFKYDRYQVEKDKVIVPKASFEGRNIIRPVFFLQRDVRRYTDGMSGEEIKRLFEREDEAIPELEFMAILFGTKDSKLNCKSH